MKSIMLVSGLLISSFGYSYTTSSSSTSFNDKLYIECDSCLTENDFIRAAESKAFLDSFSYNLKELVYVVFNSKALKLSTVRVEIGVNEIGKVIDNYEQDVAFLDQYIQKREELELSAFEPTETRPDDYSAFSNMFNVIDISPEDSFKVSLSWAYNPAFNEDIKDEVNQLVQQHANPLMFIDRPVSINVKTSDDAIVNLIAESLSENSDWEVALVLYGYRAYRGSEKEFDAMGNRLEMVESRPFLSTCFASEKFEFCRELINGNQAIGATVLRHITLKPNPTPPKGCNILTEKCTTFEN
ncbi:MAG: hypothetical protein HWE27_15915 [Gammaproteobacteria bacterium]|nr:hypothetical protein [Gammaproteobacteria bacterium]